MQHRNFHTLSLAAMLMSSLLVAACGGAADGEMSAQETSLQDTSPQETSPQETSAHVEPTETAQALSSYTWRKVADEWETFTVASSTRVRYGSGKNWIYKTLSGTVSCTNRFFGYDPLPGVFKQCDARVATVTDPAPPPPAPTCPCSAWSPSTTPTMTQASDSNAVELGVKFTTSIDGFITGIRFYKGTGNTGTHVGNLWSASGTLLARATFSAETASGWQQVNFANPVAVTANTVYVASYHAPNGKYAADLNFFATNGVTNGPVTLLSSSAAGGNGVYRYSSTTTFPASTYNAANYWVDVVFNTTSTPTTPGTGNATGTADLTWTASPEPNVSGYRVYHGTAPGSYLQPRGQGQAAGNVTSFKVSALESGKTYYFAVTAIDSAGQESSFSNEASKTIQ